MKTPMQELKKHIKDMVDNGGDMDLLCVIEMIDDKYLKKEQEQIIKASGVTFTNDELKTIKIDINHICDKISLNQLEVHKRNLILNKLEILLAD